MSMEINESLEGKMFNGWLNTLAMYEQELAWLNEQLITKSRRTHTDAAIEMDALRDMVLAQEEEVNLLTNEILTRLKNLPPANRVNKGVIPISQLIKNNHLREHIRKVERTVFYLKYHVNKLLSIAS